MFDNQKKTIKVAILDLYNGHPNQGMRCFQNILLRYQEENELEISYKIFDVRKEAQVPGTEFDIYISSGGPGSPIDTEGSVWEQKYFNLIEQIDAHNRSSQANKKHMLFVCHSFQLLCRYYQLGDVTLRHSPSFGVLPVHKTAAAEAEPLLEGLPDPFYIVDSRHWQVIQPRRDRINAMGAVILALEKERPHVPHLERCIMSLRFNDYFFGTQFHPEADPEGMKAYLLTEEKKAEVISEHGLDKYEEMLAGLEDPDKIRLTQHIIIPNFLDQAIHNLQVA